MFRILSIDGGGVRGIFPAYVLKQLSDTLNGQSLRDVFDPVDWDEHWRNHRRCGRSRTFRSSALSNSTNRRLPNLQTPTCVQWERHHSEPLSGGPPRDLINNIFGAATMRTFLDV